MIMVGLQVIRVVIPIAMLACLILGSLTGCATTDRLDAYQRTSAGELDSSGIKSVIEGDEYRTGTSSIYNTATQPGINLWLTIALVIGLIACVGLIFFLLYLDRMLKRLNIPTTDHASSSASSTPVLELYLE
ncbi:MAG: hypothetical protein JSW38_07465 [Dehalococcoidia bacterium]|nr:MAG: hypothetical protein JSW38_07465 [Dehalococcoidia bacterium]